MKAAHSILIISFLSNSLLIFSTSRYNGNMGGGAGSVLLKMGYRMRPFGVIEGFWEPGVPFVQFGIQEQIDGSSEAVGTVLMD